jgi:methyl-accepting chemotaxis protein
MFKSKLFLKSIILVVAIIVMYSVSILVFAIPKIDDSIRILEEKNAKEVLNKIETLSLNVYHNLEDYKKHTLEQHKNELRSLTDTVWSIIQSKYNESKPENIGDSLKKRAKQFEISLMDFYNINKNKMNDKELKSAIINYINIYRYDHGVGYFWINDFTPRMILHPIVPKLNGKFLGDYKDKDNVYLFNKIVKVCKEKEAGIVNYKWINPKNHKIEDKVSYVFTFKPFNWIIGTGEYKSVLENKLKNEVIDLVKEFRYGNNNYFFIYNYKNIAISHPYIQGKDMTNIKDKKGKLIVPTFIKIAREHESGFTTYWWQ